MIWSTAMIGPHLSPGPEHGFRQWRGSPPASFFPWTLAKIQAGELVQFSSVDELPDVRDRESYRRFGTKSTVIVPLSVAGQPLGALAFAAVRAERSWPPATVDRLQLVAGAFAGMLARRHADESLRAALVEVSRLKDKLQVEKVYLRKELQERTGTGLVIGESLALRRVEEQVQQVAPTNSTVLLLGETGSGKEMFATQIHELSDSAQPSDGPGELRGDSGDADRKRAVRPRKRRVLPGAGAADRPLRNGRSLDDLSRRNRRPAARGPGQAAPRTRGETDRATGEPAADSRRYADHRRDPSRSRTADRGGHLPRRSVLHRLCVFPIRVPPLRERAGDIPLLVWRFVEEFATAFGKQVDSISKDDMAALQQYSWPGNIRELRNVVERAMIMGTGRRLTFSRACGVDRLGRAQREAGGRRARAHSHGAREHGLARPGCGWCSKATRSQAHHTR